MDPELSRRAGRVMLTNTIQALGIDGRQRFVEAVERAKNWDALPLHYKDLILAAEREQTINRTIR